MAGPRTARPWCKPGASQVLSDRAAHVFSSLRGMPEEILMERMALSLIGCACLNSTVSLPPLAEEAARKEQSYTEFLLRPRGGGPGTGPRI